MDITAERVAASFASISHLKVNGRQPQRFVPMSGFPSTAVGVATAMRSHQEWLTTPMAEVSTSGPWISFMNAPTRHNATASTWRPPDDHSDAPLRGLRVLDFTRVIAGPSASQLLAALGADVLRVDSPNNPELLDQYIDTGFCKRSVELNLTDPAGLAKVHGILEEGYVVLLGYRRATVLVHWTNSA